MSQIGKNIKKIRNVKGLSQQAFADLFQLTRGNISSYEEFRAEPRLEVLVKIANYFGIPLADFIEKDLSVNELLHYNTGLVLETEKLKITQQIIKIPFIPAIYINDYILHSEDEDFMNNLPYLLIPTNSRSPLIALELDNRENLPGGLAYQNGDILIFEQVTKENIHRIPDKLGMTIYSDGIKYGIYNVKEGKTNLSLNEWIIYPFDIESDKPYWLLRAFYTQHV